MPQSPCRICKKRPIWRYHNNDLHACKRCYHRVWYDTRQRLRAYRTAIAALERGEIPVRRWPAQLSAMIFYAAADRRPPASTPWQAGR